MTRPAAVPIPRYRPFRIPDLLLSLFILLLLPGSEPAAGAGRNDTAVRIGVLAPLSGPYASGGSSFVEAATLAAERANGEGGLLGRPVEVVVGDTQGRVDVARSEAIRLLSREGATGLVGAYLSEETVGVVEAAAGARVPVIVPIAATAEITDLVRREYGRYRYVFRVGYSIPQWAGMVARFLRENGVFRYALVGASIRWNRELAAELRRILGEPAYEGFYSPGNPALEPVAVAAAQSAPQMLVLLDPGRSSLAFVKRLREGGSAFPVLSVGGTLGDRRVALSLPLSAPLFVQAAAWEGASEEATRYFREFERRFGYAPVGYSDTLPYEAMTILLAAIRRAGTRDGDAVATELERGSFRGIAGTYRFDGSHQAVWGSEELHGTVIRWDPEGARIVFPGTAVR